MPDFSWENQYTGFVVGVDEAGRGPWAGPVVSGAVWLDPPKIPQQILKQLDDSKKLSPGARAKAFAALQNQPYCRWGVGLASVTEIDELNILKATFLSMERALKQLGDSIDHVLVDGNRVPAWTYSSTPIVSGDQKSFSIAAASIVAKVTRDRLMAELAQAHPAYGWERNAGYGTAQHQKALREYGLTPHHRRSYKPIRALLENR